ncbi:MAG: hypothetical protein KGJ29_13145, partial [Hyphomicrobiales bacterium]|nr:hypothetical protein [Hyphomicrobiales bacterium]
MRKHNAKGRSKNPEGAYTLFPHKFIESEAFRSLSGAALKVFLELCSKFKGANNGNLSLSLTSATKALGMGKATLSRSLKELQEKGFIVRVQPGNWHGHQVALYALTTQKLRELPATNDWQAFQSPEVVPKPRNAYGATKAKHYQEPLPSPTCNRAAS